MKAMRCVEPNTKTISRSTDNDIRVYHFIMDFFFVLCSFTVVAAAAAAASFCFLLRFLNSLSEVVAKEERSKILTWQLYYECNYCPPTKFLIYDQILDPFKTRLICSGTVVVAAAAALKQDFKKRAPWLRSTKTATCFSTQKMHTFFIQTVYNKC